MKICPTCKIEKTYIEFNKRTSTKDGFRSQCRECEKQRSKQYNVKNADKIDGYIKQYRIDNRDNVNQSVREYSKTEQGRLVDKAKKHKRRSLIKANTPSGKHWKPQDIILKLKLQHGKCVYCETSIKNYYEIDHILPLSKGGSNESSNIQLLCRECNGASGKGSKLPHDFAQKHGMLV